MTDADFAVLRFFCTTSSSEDPFFLLLMTQISARDVPVGYGADTYVGLDLFAAALALGTLLRLIGVTGASLRSHSVSTALFYLSNINILPVR